MIISYFKFVFLRFTSSFYISSLVFNYSLSNFATWLIIMHSFHPCVDRFSLTGPSQKLKTLWKGQLSYDLLLSFPINSFKALFFKKLCQFKLIFINDIFFQWQPTFHRIYYYVGVLMKKNYCMATLRTMRYNQKTRSARKGSSEDKVNNSSNFLTVIMRCAYNLCIYIYIYMLQDKIKFRLIVF